MIHKTLTTATAFLCLMGCATTLQQGPVARETWHTDRTAPATLDSGSGEPIRVYVASFGLAGSVAETYPQLAASQVGWGICNRIVEGLYDTGRFAFVEEKAEVVEHMARLLRGGGGEKAAAEAQVPWVLYGEVVDLQVPRRETVAGFKATTEIETRITLQLRLVERSSRRFFPASATGTYTVPLREWKGGRAVQDLDARSVGLATDEAVRLAAAKLMARLKT